MRSHLQRALDERTDFGHVFELVEPVHRVGPPRDVAVVHPIIALPLEVEAGGEAVVQASERHGPVDAEPGAVVDPTEIDVREGGGILETAGDAIDRERRFAALELPPHRDATLALRHIFPGGPGDVDGSRRIGIGRYFSRRERARVVGARIPAHVGGGRERPPVPKREVPPRVEVTEVGVGMLPLARVVEP